MPLIHVALQEGFSGDTVSIRLNGQEVFRKSDVKTRLQIGLADSFETNVEEGPATVEVSLPSRSLSESIETQVSGALYIGVSVTPEGKISYRVSNEPFGYL